MYFEVVSGLKINLSKSEIFEVKDVSDLNNLAWTLGYKIGFLQSSYLGIPLYASFKSKKVWDSVI